MMKARNLNLAFLCVAMIICAVWARDAYHRRQDPANFGDPNQLVVETNYSVPWHKELCIRRGPDRLLDLRKSYRYGSGSKADQVVAVLGVPKYRFEFLSDEYFVWRNDVRYDWDRDEKFAGGYLSICFDYDDSINSVTITSTPPLDSKTTNLDEFSRRRTKAYEW